MRPEDPNLLEHAVSSKISGPLGDSDAVTRPRVRLQAKRLMPAVFKTIRIVVFKARTRFMDPLTDMTYRKLAFTA